MLEVLTHLIFFLLTSQFTFGFYIFLYMVCSNNKADFHNQNSVDDKKWDQPSKQICTLIFFSINMKKVMLNIVFKFT